MLGAYFRDFQNKKARKRLAQQQPQIWENLQQRYAYIQYIMNNSSCTVFYFPVFFVVLSLSNHGNFLLSSNKQQQQKLFALQYSICIKEFEWADALTKMHKKEPYLFTFLHDMLESENRHGISISISCYAKNLVYKWNITVLIVKIDKL